MIAALIAWRRDEGLDDEARLLPGIIGQRDGEV